jgi:fucose permease
LALDETNTGNQILAFGLSFTVDFGTSKGLGRDNANIPETWIPALLASEYAFTILYNPALMATKTSILMFYLRISKGTQRFFRISTYVTLAVVNIGGITVTFFSAFQCRPPRAAYDLSVQNPSCISILSIYLASAPLNVASDLAILVLPIPVLTGMRLPRKQKTIIVFLFTLGVFVTIMGVVRIYYLQLAANESQTQQVQSTPESLDHSTASLALLWSTIEVNVGIICACIPIMKPLIVLLLPRLLFDPCYLHGSDRESAFPRQVGNSAVLDASSLTVSHVQSHDTPNQDLSITTAPNLSRLDAPAVVLSPDSPSHHSDNSVHFSFIHMKQPTCMLYSRGWESFKYCGVVSIVFFLWGFSYGILTSLNSQTPNMTDRTLTQVVSVLAVFFAGYLIGPLLVGQWVLRRFGFKTTLITGLGIFCLGTLMYWPSGALGSYPAFVVSNFVIGFGLSIIELATNLFLVLCGAPEYAETRILIAQGVQTVASFFSGLLSRSVFYVSIPSTQWIYLGCALVLALLALFFYYIPLPEASDSELYSQAESLKMHRSEKYRGTVTQMVANFVLFFLALFIVNGVTQSIDIFFAYLPAIISKMTGTTQTFSTNKIYMFGTGMFAFGRFLCAFLCLFIPPRILVLVCFTGALVFSTLITSFNLPNVNFIAAAGIAISFFEGPLFPLLYAMAVRGLGRWTRLGGAVQMTANCGALPFLYIMLAVAHPDGRSLQHAFFIPVGIYAGGVSFALYLNLFPVARHLVDPVALPSQQLRLSSGSTAYDVMASGGQCSV